MPQAEHTPSLITPAQAESKPGSTHESGIRFPARLSDRSTPLTKWEDLIQIFELLYRRLGMTLGLECEETENALEVAVFEGVYRKSDGTDVTFAGNSAFSVPDDTTAYKLYILASTNALTGAASWPGDQTTFVPIAEVDTADGAVSEIRDMRPYLALRIPQALSDSGQTNHSTFTIDADATVDGDRDLVLNRTATLAAALKWAQSSGLLELLEDKDTSTLAKVNLLELHVSGTKVVDANGAAKVASAVAGDGLTHTSGVLTPNVDNSSIEVDGGTKKIQAKDGGISTAKLNTTLQDYLAQVSVADASGASPQTIDVQVKDAAGNNLSEVIYLEVGVYDDADLQTESVNGTIADGGSGSFLDAITTNKVYRAKTDSAGLLQVAVSGPTGTYYLGIRATRGSKILDCSDIGTVTIS